jgi:predicted nucleic acid-binding protein
VTWLNSVDENRLYVSVIAMAEIQKGISKLADSALKSDLQLWLYQALLPRFGERVLDVSRDVALLWGVKQGNFAKKRESLPVIDSLLGVTAIHHDLTIVTRNTRDFERMPVELVNPWGWSLRGSGLLTAKSARMPQLVIFHVA